MTALVVEVSDTTLRYDLVRKAARYAAAAVPEYWLLNITQGQLHQHWQPGPEAYLRRRTLALGERIEAATIQGLGFETEAI